MSHAPSFLKSALEVKDFPLHEGSEIAFLGASNSGKSSLVNVLLGKDLCKTSSKPGHTRLINFFSAKKSVYFVDLPGYGYAQKSKKEQEKWQMAIENYLVHRKQLVCCMVLFDLKRGLMANDEDLIDWLKHMEVPYALVATKVDKLNQKEKSQAKKKLVGQLLGSTVHMTSSKKGLGVSALWNHIDSLIELTGTEEC